MFILMDYYLKYTVLWSKLLHPSSVMLFPRFYNVWKQLKIILRKQLKILKSTSVSNKNGVLVKPEIQIKDHTNSLKFFFFCYHFPIWCLLTTFYAMHNFFYLVPLWGGRYLPASKKCFVMVLQIICFPVYIKCLFCELT